MAERKAKNRLSKLSKDKKEESPIVLQTTKTTIKKSSKAVTFAESSKVIEKEGGGKLVETRTREIKLPARYK